MNLRKVYTPLNVIQIKDNYNEVTRKQETLWVECKLIRNYRAKSLWD